MAIYVADAFNRTISSGWGTADVGGAWFAPSTASVATSGATRPEHGTGILTKDTKAATPTVSAVTARLTVEFLIPTSGGAAQLNLRVPSFQANTAYRLHMVPQSSCTIRRGGTPLGTLTGTTVSRNVTHTAVVEVEGTSPTVIRAKVWPTGTAEPSAWAATVSDSTAALQAEGAWGVEAIGGPTFGTALLVQSFTVEDLVTAPPLFAGTQQIEAVYAGATPIEAIYQGPTKLWP